MAGNSREIVDSLISKFRAISDLCKTLDDENGKLKEALAAREDELENLRQQHRELEQKYKNLKLSKNIAAQESDTGETKARFARLVREIDKCISLLNE